MCVCVCVCVCEGCALGFYLSDVSVGSFAECRDRVDGAHALREERVGDELASVGSVSECR